MTDLNESSSSTDSKNDKINLTKKRKVWQSDLHHLAFYIDLSLHIDLDLVGNTLHKIKLDRSDQHVTFFLMYCTVPHTFRTQINFE